MEPHEFIEGSDQVIAHLGLWPSFHDAEVMKLALDRTKGNDPDALVPALDLHLRGWVMSSEVSEKGFFTLRGDAIYHFRFEGVFNLKLEGFNNQNVLSCLSLELVNHPSDPDRAVLLVDLEHCFEFEASFAAQRARVVSITPYA